jgi:hypothetical protein
MDSFTVCTQCSTGIVNDDWTFLDMDADNEEEWLDLYASHTASVESMGIVAMGRKLGGIGEGYFRCYVCGSDEIGGYIWEKMMS